MSDLIPVVDPQLQLRVVGTAKGKPLVVQQRQAKINPGVMKGTISHHVLLDEIIAASHQAEFSLMEPTEPASIQQLEVLISRLRAGMTKQSHVSVQGSLDGSCAVTIYFLSNDT